MKQVNEYKVYVPVEVRFTEDGTMLPRYIVWEDGKKYRDLSEAETEELTGKALRKYLSENENLVLLSSERNKVFGIMAMTKQKQKNGLQSRKVG